MYLYAYYFEKKKRKLCSINLYFPCISVSAFLLALHQRLDGVTPRSLFFSLPPSSIAQYFSSVLRFDSLSTSPCHTPQFSLFPANTLPTPPPPLPLKDFPLLRLDDIVDEQSNIVGFSMFNTTHPFYLEFIRSLNLSWREGCDLTYPGPAVSISSPWVLMRARY